MNPESSRLQIVDSLRGFAIVSIMLLHNIEHFDYYFNPTNLPAWMPGLDKAIWNTLFFLFAGKSYAIFALLFGLTFYIQDRNQEKLGKDFRLRFAWRLILLLGFGIMNTAFYQGDILVTYALIGFTLIPVARLHNNWVLVVAVILILQPFEWFKFFRSFSQAGIKPENPSSWAYFGKMGEYIPGNSILETWKGNLLNGKVAVLLWTWEAGRVLQTSALFMLGMIAGRRRLFALNELNIIFWKRLLLMSFLLFIPLFYINAHLVSGLSNESMKRALTTIFSSWSNLAFMFTLVSGMVLLSSKAFFNSVQAVLSPLGRMSLSNYVIQSVLGASIYYGYGLGMYKYTGATYSILIGLTLAILQCIFSWYWMKNHQQGPLESIWHKLTWIGTNKVK